MYDTGKIAIGVLATLTAVTFPFWFAVATGAGQAPELELPSNHDRCIESTEFMRSSHMQLLTDWRDSVVREGVREYTATDGRKFEMSLTKTCLDCHTSRQNFCGRCHEYVGASPNCWDCHLDRKD